MKAIVTLFFALFITATALGNTNEIKVETTIAPVRLEINILKNNTPVNQVARLYLDKNSRVKKSLKFITKKNKAKMA